MKKGLKNLILKLYNDKRVIKRLAKMFPNAKRGFIFLRVDKKEIAKRAAYETLRMFFNKEKVAPIEVASYEFNSDGSVTITLTCDAKLVNENSGFEVYVDGKYSYDCNVSISGNKLTVTADGEITKVRYGYTCKVTEELKTDVSKSVTVFDNSGFPLDLFLIEK
jgi:archaellum component FlaF (FlaF/FlaG flagellin family)